MMLTEEQWAQIEPFCRGKAGDPGRSGANNRLFLEAVLWIARTGSPWRDLPEEFGRWNSIFQRFRRWAKTNHFKHIFDKLSNDADFEYGMVDGSIVKVHRHGQGAKGGLKIRPSARAEAD
jgi:transposase